MQTLQCSILSVRSCPLLSVSRWKSASNTRVISSADARCGAVPQAAEPPLPLDLDYNEVDSLRLEARQKLNAVKPLNFGQAARISGVSPADITALMIYIETHKKEEKA